MTTYASNTQFDLSLTLNITEKNTGSKTEYRFTGFRNYEEAKEFANWWGDSWYGYCPSAVAAFSSKQNPIVLASRYNSCD